MRTVLPLAAAALCWFGVGKSLAQPINPESERANAHNLFLRGQVRESIAILQQGIARDPAGLAAARARLDLMEYCTAARLLRCIYDAGNALIVQIPADTSLADLAPDVLSFILRERVFTDDRAYIDKFIADGGALRLADPLKRPVLYAETEFALHSAFVRRNDLKSADEAWAGAMTGFLLSDPKDKYVTCRVLVGLLSALLERQDIVGAAQLHATVDAYLKKSIPAESVLAADYASFVVRLRSYSTDNSRTMTAADEAYRLFAKLDIDDESRAYEMAVATSLGSAAAALDGDLDRARKLHARHPMQKQKTTLFERGRFATIQELYFAASDVFLAFLSNTAIDRRWRPLLEKELESHADDVERAENDSYRIFALGLAKLADAGDNKDKRGMAITLLVKAANERIDNFERVLRNNLQGFQLPGLVDRVIISFPLRFLSELDQTSAAELTLRSNEVLSRSLRHEIGDEAVFYAAQPDGSTLAAAHDLVNLRREKRVFELDRVRAHLVASEPGDPGTLLPYSNVTDVLSKIAASQLSSGSFGQANGLPTIRAVQASLGSDEALVTVAETPAGLARLCVDQAKAVVAVEVMDVKALSAPIRLLEFATTASRAPDPALDSEFPVDAAIRLKKALFDGLDDCFRPGRRIVLALPASLATIPAAALLSERPPAMNDGFDLAKARWLVRDFSFSTVVSVRQHVAARSAAVKVEAKAGFVGIGNPVLNGRTNQMLRRVLGERLHAEPENFTALPETADELRKAVSAFSNRSSTVLTAGKATEENFRSLSLANIDVIHFATHAHFSDSTGPLGEAALILTPGNAADPLDDGVLSASEISRLPLGARLIVLSACNSARFDQKQASLGVRDLQAAFAAAGARTIVASLWPVESLTTANIIGNFVSLWRTGRAKTAAAALAQAMRNYLDGADAAHQHPRFWAPFMVAGDGSIEGPTASVQPGRFALTALPPFGAAGAIVHGRKLGNDLVVSVVTDVNGVPNSGLIARLRQDGREVWRSGGADLRFVRIALDDKGIWAPGYRNGTPLVPIVRRLDPSGRTQWQRDYPELSGYLFADVALHETGAYIVAVPERAQTEDALLLQLDEHGDVSNTIRIANKNALPIIANSFALLEVDGDLVRIVLNHFGALTLDPRRRDVIGLPRACDSDQFARVLEYDRASLALRRDRRLSGFQARAIAHWRNGMILAGEVREDCSLIGHGALLSLPDSGDALHVWADTNLFPSTVWGLSAADKLEVALNVQRTVTLPSEANGKRADTPRRRGAYAGATNYGELLTIRADGKLESKRNLATGLDTFLSGIERINGRAVLFGNIGGRPALTLN
jgi:CHAT domain-containing protein